MSLLTGNSTVYSNVGIQGDGTHPTIISRYGYVAGASGTATTISLLAGASSQNNSTATFIVMGVYADAAGATLLGYTGAVAVTGLTASQLITGTITVPFAIASGTTYYPGLIMNGNSLYCAYNDPTYWYTSGTYPTLPTSPAGANSNANGFVMRVDGTTPGGFGPLLLPSTGLSFLGRR